MGLIDYAKWGKRAMAASDWAGNHANNVGASEWRRLPWGSCCTCWRGGRTAYTRRAQCCSSAMVELTRPYPHLLLAPEFGTERFWPTSGDYKLELDKCERILRTFTVEGLPTEEETTTTDGQKKKRKVYRKIVGRLISTLNKPTGI